MSNQVSFPGFRRRQGDTETPHVPDDRRDRADVFRRPFGRPTPPVDAPAEAPAQPELPLTREQVRSRRKRDVRGTTISVKRITKRELALGRMLYPVEEHEDVSRPKTRAACADVPRPCPFVSCKHHLYLDVSARTGAIKVNFPDLEPDELPADASCSLDVADRQGITLEETGAAMNLTRERIRQVEVKAFAKLHAAREMTQLRDLAGLDGSVGKRRLPVVQDEGGGDDEAEAAFDVDAFASDELDSE